MLSVWENTRKSHFWWKARPYNIKRKAKILCIRLGEKLFVFFLSLEREREEKEQNSHPDGSSSEATRTPRIYRNLREGSGFPIT